MAQLIVRNLENEVRDLLRERAKLNGRSMEEEIRHILRAAAVSPTQTAGPGLGSRITKRFAECGIEQHIAEWRGESIDLPSFE